MHSGIPLEEPPSRGAAGKRNAMQKQKLEGKKRARVIRILVFAAVILAVDLTFSACTGTGKEAVILSEDGRANLLSSSAEEETKTTEEADRGASLPAEDAAKEQSAEAVTESPAEKICVDVCGAVQNEGVVYLDAGARVYEAIEAAGGFTQEADKRAVNQAMVLADGVQLRIPTKEETQQGGGIVSGIVSETPAAAGGSGSDLVNINTADEKTLETLPGIGAAKAAAILEYREKNGSFQKTEDIKNVPGIKDAGYEKIRDRITCG